MAFKEVSQNGNPFVVSKWNQNLILCKNLPIIIATFSSARLRAVVRLFNPLAVEVRVDAVAAAPTPVTAALATPPTTLPYNEKIHVSTGLLKKPSSIYSRFIKLFFLLKEKKFEKIASI